MRGDYFDQANKDGNKFEDGERVDKFKAIK